MISRRIVLAAILLAAAFQTTVWAAGSPIGCVMTEEDVGNGYLYTVPGIGTFSVNCQEQETVAVAVFDVGEGGYPVYLKDGQEIVYDGMLYESGEYEFRLYGNEEREGDYGSFRFTIENTLTSGLEEGETRTLTEVRDPELTLSYDETTGMFRYTLPDGVYFDTNIPIGGWYRGQARLQTSEGLNIYQTYLDGESLGYLSDLSFNRVGSYEIVLRDNELGSRGDISYRLSLAFHLYVDETMNLTHINTPMGLRLSRVLWNGEEVPPESPDYFRAVRDGSYRLEYTDGRGVSCWSMEFKRDTTPPFIRFTPPLTEETLQEYVSFSPSEVTATVRIERNQEEVAASLNQIRVNGRYHMEITDTAGNMRDYDFSIRKLEELDPHMWIIILCVLLALAAAGAVYWRRSMRVL